MADGPLVAGGFESDVGSVAMIAPGKAVRFERVSVVAAIDGLRPGYAAAQRRVWQSRPTAGRVVDAVFVLALADPALGGTAQVR